MTTPSPQRDVASGVGPNRWTVALFALVGLGAGLLVFAVRGPTYEAEALVAVSNPLGTLADEAEIVTSDAVLDVAERSLGFEPDVTVTSAEVAGLLTITSKADDAQRAANAANAVANTYMQAQTSAAANIAQPAVAPTSASGLGLTIYVLVGSLLGAAAGAVASYLQSTGVGASAKRDRTRVRPPRHSATSVASPGAAAGINPTNPASGPAAQSQPAPAPPPIQSAPAPGLAPTPEPTQPAAAPSLAPTPGVEPNRASDRRADHPEPDRASAHPPPTHEGPMDSHDTNDLRQPDDAPADEPAPTWSSPLTPAAAAVPAHPAESDARPSSFSSAASAEDGADDSAMPPPSDGLLPDNPWSTGPDQGADPLALERRALQSRFDEARRELELARDHDIARLKAIHERQSSELRNEIGELNKQLRKHAVRLNARDGNDQHRVGDLEAQVDALEVELATLRQQLESQRIAHTKRLTDERGATDRALDNARREYREELAKHVHAHRAALAKHQAELDETLSQDRAKQAKALDELHRDYEKSVDAERRRASDKIEAAEHRHQRELQDLRTKTDEKLARQAAQHKETISQLRNTNAGTDNRINDLDKTNRLLRAELAQAQKQLRNAEAELGTTSRRLGDETVLLRAELDSERERNAALRADVLRRSAEAHQAIDRAVEERTAQLAELEASVTRQREYADTRVREISAASEERSRQAAAREASLTATVSRLKRELEELKQKQGHE